MLPKVNCQTILKIEDRKVLHTSRLVQAVNRVFPVARFDHRRELKFDQPAES